VVEESKFSPAWVVGSLILILVLYVAYVNRPRGASEPHGPEIDITAEVPAKTAPDEAETIGPEIGIKEAVTDTVGAEHATEEKPNTDTGIRKKPPPTAVTKIEPAAASIEKKKAEQNQAAVAPPVKKYKYRLVVTAHDEDAWILVVVDDVIERDMFVRAGQKIVIVGNDSFNFTTGNARQVSLTLNGEPLKFDVPPNNVLRSWNIPLPGAE